MEMDPPAGGWTVDLPLPLLIVLVLMWCWFAWREPKGERESEGWYVLPGIISIAAFVGVTVLGL